MQQRLELRYPRAKLILMGMKKYQDRIGKNYQKDD